MADQKVSQLPAMTAPSSEDLMLIIDNPTGTPSSKSITIKRLFGNIPCNTSISGLFAATANATFSGSNTVIKAARVQTTFSTQKLTVTSNTYTISNSLTPANSTITMAQGSFFWDANYLYCATSNNNIKRVAWSSF